MTCIELLDSLVAEIRADREKPRHGGIVYLCGVCHRRSADEVIRGKQVCSSCAPLERRFRMAR